MCMCMCIYIYSLSCLMLWCFVGCVVYALCVCGLCCFGAFALLVVCACWLLCFVFGFGRFRVRVCCLWLACVMVVDVHVVRLLWFVCANVVCGLFCSLLRLIRV